MKRKGHLKQTLIDVFRGSYRRFSYIYKTIHLFTNFMYFKKREKKSNWGKLENRCVTN